ncbi:Ldh family oxidoreductase, partial [Salmonella enterica]|uniref:Ldh family oxidoreductase n=1 Tax=Salmonella enterica TaxID=28901 RepID=UPI000AA001F2
ALSWFIEQSTSPVMVSIAITHTETCVAPYGVAERLLGTNPIALGFPVIDSHPMIIDMATSAITFGKMRHAKETGKAISHGLAL